MIVDEIHALVPTKRGAHMALSLERLEALRAQDDVLRESDGRGIQRIGLSATQRPLDEVARFLAEVWKGKRKKRVKGKRRKGKGKRPRPERGADVTLSMIESPHGGSPENRPVTIVDTSAEEKLDLRIEVPVEDMAKIGQLEELPSGPASRGPVRTSIWTAFTLGFSSSYARTARR